MARRADPAARERLLAAARTIFAEHGVDAARVEDITSAAGLSKGSFYLHFDSKEAAFGELVGAFFATMGELTSRRQAAIQGFRARHGAVVPDDPRALAARLAAFAELDHEYTVLTLQALWDERDMLRCVLEQGTGPRAVLVERLTEVVREMLARQLQEAVEHSGVRGDLDQDLVSELIIGLYLQLGRRMIRIAERPDFATWARTVNALLVEGIAARPPSTPHPGACASQGVP